MKSVSLAGGSIGIALLAASLVHASIVYSGDQHIAISPYDYRTNDAVQLNNPNTLRLDLNSDGVDDFALFTIQPIPVFPDFVFFAGEPLNGGFYSGSNSIVFEHLSKGAVINSSELTEGDPGWMEQFPNAIWHPDAFVGFFGTTSSDANEFYFSLKFKIGQNFHFAWIGAQFPVSFGDPFIIDGWAYETVSGTSIVAGDEGLRSSPVPEPSTYGAFAATSLLGLAFLRRRKGK